MAEPQADAPKQPERPTPPPAAAQVTHDLLLGAHFEPSDDAPTIISKNPRAPRADEAFTATLRGRTLAHFELIEPIGVGGMAAVIRAQDTQLERSVALKILPPEMAVDPENIRRFHQEARAAAKLDHENIARVFFCGEDQGLHFIAFEFVEGENLRTLLDRRGRIPVPEAVHYMLQVATGLAHASARGVVHRDIKPSNIIVSSNGRAKLVDMGLARSLEPQSDHGLTQSGVTLGTFDYISPEQALEPREADVRSDIYSLGCTFYHMLTGRPPVPEGTAAKKLHHHQHVAPIDPRQINPDIPDEVAAVLARMMAKDPKDRYQRPENLVQHLIQLAHKLGAIAEVPDGVLFVDAPLPSPPQSRPILVAIAAAFVLVALVVLHGMSPWQGPRPVVTRGPNGSTGGEVTGTQSNPLPARVPEQPSDNPRPPVKPLPTLERRSVKTAKELADFLDDFRNHEATSAEVFLENDLDLTREEPKAGFGTPPGLIFEGLGRHLVIQPKDPTGRRKILLSYKAVDGAADWTAFTVRGGEAVLRRLRFEVDATQASHLLMAAVKLQEAGQLVLEDCEFIQIDPPIPDPANALGNDAGRLSSVVVEGPDAPRLTLRTCYFGALDKTASATGGSPVSAQDAVTLTGAATVEATDCMFAPHAALFHVQKGNGQGASVTLRRCSAFLVEGTVIHMTGTGDDNVKVSGLVRVFDSLFSHPGDTVLGNSPATLIFQTGDGSSLRFVGNDNCYHNLNPFWLKASLADATPLTVAGDWDKFRQILTAKGGSDEKSRILTASPWADKDPLRLLKSDPPYAAFEVNPTLRDVRQADNPERVVGVERYPGDKYGKYARKWPRLDPDRKSDALAGKIIVDPDNQSGNGTYQTLNEAASKAKAGDEILIKYTGLLRVEPIKLEHPIPLTIKPYRDEQHEEHPILTLGGTTENDAALFRVHDGALNLENLEFLLRPGKSEVKSQPVVRVVGDGECHFKNCVVTLEEPHGVPLAVVELADSTGFMKMDPQPARPLGPPKVRLERCFVRGEGDFLAVRASRPCVIEVEESLVAMAGSFLNVESNSKEPAPPVVQVRLARVTAYVADHLVRLASRDLKWPVSLQFKEPADCLFASKEGSKPLIHLEGLEAPDAQLKQLFNWESGTRNAYSRFTTMLDQQARPDEMPSHPFQPDKWKIFFNEMDGTFTPVRYSDPPGALLSRVLPANFKVKAETELQRFGASLDQLPKPALENTADQAAPASK